jgi:hypothetical protein
MTGGASIGRSVVEWAAEAAKRPIVKCMSPTEWPAGEYVIDYGEWLKHPESRIPWCSWVSREKMHDEGKSVTNNGFVHVPTPDSLPQWTDPSGCVGRRRVVFHLEETKATAALTCTSDHVRESSRKWRSCSRQFKRKRIEWICRVVSGPCFHRLDCVYTIPKRLRHRSNMSSSCWSYYYYHRRHSE